MQQYKLRWRKPVKCKNVVEWAKWFERAKRRIRRTQVTKEVYVSTVFIGTWEGELFETMVFSGERGGLQLRTNNHRDALKNHWLAVEKAKQ